MEAYMVDNSPEPKAKIEILEDKARELRRKVIEVLGNGGHPGFMEQCRSDRRDV